MARGVIRKWFEDYALIRQRGEGQPDVYFRRRAWRGTDWDALIVGMAVEFEPEDRGDGALHARCVRPAWMRAAT